VTESRCMIIMTQVRLSRCDLPGSSTRRAGSEGNRQSSSPVCSWPPSTLTGFCCCCCR